MTARTDRHTGEAAGWVVRGADHIDAATADRAARGQASLADGLARLRSVRFPLLPSPVEPATGDRAVDRAAAAAAQEVAP